MNPKHIICKLLYIDPDNENLSNQVFFPIDFAKILTRSVFWVHMDPSTGLGLNEFHLNHAFNGVPKSFSSV